MLVILCTVLYIVLAFVYSDEEIKAALNDSSEGNDYE